MSWYFFFFALRIMLYLFYLFGLFTKVPQVPHPLQNQHVLNQKVLENLFSSSLNAFSFVGRPQLKTSLSLAFHLLRFYSPHCYLKSVVWEHVYRWCRENSVKKIKLQHKCTRGILYNVKILVATLYLLRRDCIVNILLSCVQYSMLPIIFDPRVRFYWVVVINHFFSSG
mgnify:CR=1 FL=1